MKRRRLFGAACVGLLVGASQAGCSSNVQDGLAVGESGVEIPEGHTHRWLVPGFTSAFVGESKPNVFDTRRFQLHVARPVGSSTRCTAAMYGRAGGEAKRTIEVSFDDAGLAVVDGLQGSAIPTGSVEDQGSATLACTAPDVTAVVMVEGRARTSALPSRLMRSAYEVVPMADASSAYLIPGVFANFWGYGSEVVVFNPHAVGISVTATARGSTGATTTSTRQIPAHGSVTLRVDDEGLLPSGMAGSLELSATAPVAVVTHTRNSTDKYYQLYSSTAGPSDARLHAPDYLKSFYGWDSSANVANGAGDQTITITAHQSPKSRATPVELSDYFGKYGFKAAYSGDGWTWPKALPKDSELALVFTGKSNFAGTTTYSMAAGELKGHAAAHRFVGAAGATRQVAIPFVSKRDSSIRCVNVGDRPTRMAATLGGRPLLWDDAAREVRPGEAVAVYLPKQTELPDGDYQGTVLSQSESPIACVVNHFDHENGANGEDGLSSYNAPNIQPTARSIVEGSELLLTQHLPDDLTTAALCNSYTAATGRGCTAPVWPVLDGLRLSGNPPPPDALSGGALEQWKASREYRGYAHFHTTLGCTNGRPSTVWSDADSSTGYTKFPGLNTFGAGDIKSGYAASSVAVRGACVEVKERHSSRVAHGERSIQFNATGYDAPYIYADTTETVCCDGSAELQIHHSSFPDTRLYLEGTKRARNAAGDFGTFLVSGGQKWSEDGQGNMAPAGRGFVCRRSASSDWSCDR